MTPVLTPLEKELLTELVRAEERFLRGDLKEGTIRSHALFHMARRRDETMPAPVAGKSTVSSKFQGIFTRTLNRLVAKRLVKKRKVHNFKGHPSQWGYANHQKRNLDLFLSQEGRALAKTMAEEDQAKSQPPATSASSSIPGVVANKTPPPRVGIPGITYVQAPQKARRATRKILDQWTYDFGVMNVTYLLMKKTDH